METTQLQSLRDAVAQRVMGWHREDIPWAYDGTAGVWHDERGTPLLTVHSWQPDEHDEQCMQVVDRMLALGFSLHMDCCHDGCAVSFTIASGHAAPATRNERRPALLRAALEAMTLTEQDDTRRNPVE